MKELSDGLKDKTYEEFIESLIIKRIIKSPIPSLTFSLLADGCGIIEIEDVRVNEILMNAKIYADIRSNGRHLLDPETEVEKLKKGIMAYLWGSTIIVTKKIPDSTVLILSDSKEKMGAVLKIREGIFDDVKELLKQASELKKIAHNSINKANEIETTIYRITKTEE